MFTIRRRIILPLAALTLLSLTGCEVNLDSDSSGPPRNDTKSIELDKSEFVRVVLHMGAGELDVRGGSSKLMDAEFHYSNPRMRPEVRYDGGAFRGHLEVQEPSTHFHGGNSKYRWDLRFNDDKPLDMEVHFGAGQGRLDLGTLSLRSLEVHMGVGELRVDLRGTPKHDYDVNIHGGVGEVTVYLPEGVGISADASGGIGGISARGLQNRGGRYVNDAYGHAKTNIHLQIRGGIGSINLIGG
jgi:N-terminal domain of toast_rack, DUF2154